MMGSWGCKLAAPPPPSRAFALPRAAPTVAVVAATAVQAAPVAVVARAAPVTAATVATAEVVATAAGAALAVPRAATAAPTAPAAPTTAAAPAPLVAAVALANDAAPPLPLLSSFPLPSSSFALLFLLILLFLDGMEPYKPWRLPLESRHLSPVAYDAIVRRARAVPGLITKSDGVALSP